jgi:alpha-beta hydrolase superfamily lysophospholipase
LGNLASPAPAIITWTASDGYRAYARRYDPPGAPRAHVLCLHGIQSHGGWYEYSCGRLAAAGFAVHFLDRRGSGLNCSARGDTPSFRRLLDDVGEYRAGLGTEQPCLLVAGSWGGKVAVGLCRRHPNAVHAVALLCPGLCPKVGPPPGQRLRIGVSRFVAPRRRFPVPLNDPALFTASPRWRDFIAADPLALREATARLLFESVRLDIYVRRSLAWVTVPVLLLLAEHDAIIDNGRTRQLVERFATADRTVIEYPGAHHTLEFEPNPDLFIADLVAWLVRVTK